MNDGDAHMISLRIIVACMSLTASAAVSASDDQRFIGVECDVRREMLRVSYHSDHLHVLFDEGFLVDTFNLKKNDASGSYVESLRQIVKKCRIKKTNYVVHLRAVPGNWNLNGMCGGATFGGATINADGKRILDIEFESCSGGEITAAVTFKGGSTLPTIDTGRTVGFQ